MQGVGDADLAGVEDHADALCDLSEREPKAPVAGEVRYAAAAARGRYPGVASGSEQTSGRPSIETTLRRGSGAWTVEKME
jgi:hypothetical protein